ncbi:MAG: EAL domain-containing protein [Spirochaetales bacterium]|nr:EAL domain-containing protein [Spirochaetales bacterium]
MTRKKSIHADTSRSGKTIALLLVSFFDDYQYAIFTGVRRYVEMAGVRLVCFVGNSLDSPHFYRKQRNVIYELVGPENVDGIIGISGSLGNHVSPAELLAFYSKFAPLPMTSVGVAIEGVPSIIVDNENGMRDLMKHVIETHGARRIAYIRGTKNNPEAVLRFGIYRETLEAYNIPYEPDLVVPGDFLGHSGAEAAKLLVDKRKVKFDALIGANDSMIICAAEELKRRGMRIPDDVILAGFDDIVKARNMDPPLTTVRQPLARMGELAVERLVEVMRGGDAPPVTLLSTELVIRQSCGCFLQREEYADLREHSAGKKAGRKRRLSGRSQCTERLVEAMKNRFLSAGDTGLFAEWADVLCTALTHDVGEKKYDLFLPGLEKIILEAAVRGRPVQGWYRIVGTLCEWAEFFLTRAEEEKRFLRRLHAFAFEVIGRVAFRVEEAEKNKLGEELVDMYRINEEMIAYFDLDNLKKIVMDWLSYLGIDMCSIALYDKSHNSGRAFSKVIMSYRDGKEVVFSGKKASFPSRLLVPGTLRKQKEKATFIVLALCFREENLGFIVFEYGPDNPVIYENFSNQFAGSLKGAMLVAQVEKHARELAVTVDKRTDDLKKTNKKLKDEIEKRKKTEDALIVEKGQALVTLESIGDGVITTNTKGIITYINPVAEDLTGWPQKEAIGMPLKKVFNVVYRLSECRISDPVEIVMGRDRGFKLSGLILLKSRDMQEYEITESISPIRDFDGRIIGVVIVIHNVSETQRMSRQISYQSTHDMLTGLYNRIKFEDFLAEVMDSLKHEKKENVICFLDIDNFRVINDSCGSVAGDELLRDIGALLKGIVRQTDILSRLGGDQFGLLLPLCPFHRAREIVDTILKKVADFSFEWKGEHFKISLGIGFVHFDSFTHDISKILTAANIACHLAKKKGKNQVHVYHTEDEEFIKYHSEIYFLPHITRALKENRFCLYKQVIRPIGYGLPENDHFEIFIRMIDEEGRIIPPSIFIAIAERYNLMPDIDRWVIEKLFSSYIIDYYETPDKAYAKYNINLNGTTLNDTKFLDFVMDKLIEYDIPPYMICFEITETYAISNFAQVKRFIKELKKIGCFFSLDDFGSGFSSFNYLKLLPVDFLKIEGAFVKEISKNSLDLVLVRTMNDIGHVMGLKTIAEYVEDEETLKRLKQIGVDYAQGYEIAKPELLVL